MHRWDRVAWLAAFVAFGVLAPARAEAEGEPERPANAPRPAGWWDRWGADDAGADAAERVKRRIEPRPAIMQPRPAEPPAPVVLAAGKLYLLVGATLKRFDAETLALEASAALPLADDERAQRVKQAFMQRWDKNGDNAVTPDEMDRPELVQNLDKNGDGMVTPDEVPAPRALPASAMAAGPATLLVEGASAFVFARGKLFRFKADTLELQATATVETPPETVPGAPTMKVRTPTGQPTAPGALRERLRRKDAAPVEQAPTPPEEPVKF
jgi:hypothetical protein